MMISRRRAVEILAGSVPAVALAQALGSQLEGVQIAKGPFQPDRESLKANQVPQWFRDAKFGIWAHWGPQSAPEYGDWYARNMYIQGHRQYKYHVQKYGHPSKFGFKDIIPTWKAQDFDPDYLIGLYKKAGAKYFVSMGVHHDNFDLWNSKHQPRWNSVASGPRKDIVGLFKKAAQKHGLRFGVSEHLAVSYHWFQTSHGSDKEGPLQGVPYDGTDPAFADLYHETHETPQNAWDPRNVPVSWKRQYLLRIQDLIDQYDPDLLYTDGPVFFEEWGLAIIAHLYNRSIARRRGAIDVVYTNKGRKDCENGACVLDVERGIVDRIWPAPWQTDTCVGDWHYNVEAKYKTPKIVIDMLVDIVSRNGNLLLNFPLPSSGALDSAETRILDEITQWMAVNSEGIYATRPWKIFGDGPVAKTPPGGGFNERARKEMTPEDVRFTSKGNTLYVFVMGIPEKETVIPSLASGGPASPAKILNLELLGAKGAKLKWTQDASGLRVELPEKKPSRHVLGLKLTAA